jgi:hypothetical protein
MAPERLADAAECALDRALDRGVGTAAPGLGSARPSRDARKDPSRDWHLPDVSGDDGYYTVRPPRGFPRRLDASSRHAKRGAHRSFDYRSPSPSVAGAVRARAPRARQIGARVRPLLRGGPRGVRERRVGRARGPLGRARGRSARHRPDHARRGCGVRRARVRAETPARRGPEPPRDDHAARRVPRRSRETRALQKERIDVRVVRTDERRVDVQSRALLAVRDGPRRVGQRGGGRRRDGDPGGARRASRGETFRRGG